MKSFGTPGYLVGNARLEVRLVYTGFLVLAMIGMATMAVFQLKHIGPLPMQIAAYYRGGERDGAMLFPKTLRELIEVTHFHAFTFGVVYLVLAHLFLATTVTERIKRTLVVIGAVGLVGDLGGVWLIRYVSAAFAYPQVLFWAAEWVAFLAFVFYPLKEMWFRNERQAYDGE